MPASQKKLVFLISLTIIVILVCPYSVYAQNDNRGLIVAAAPIAGSEAVGKQYAVFIAIDRYKEWPPLKNAVSDAEHIRTVLEKRYYIDQIYTRYDEMATKEEVMKLFENLSNELRPEDSLFVFYAGHGVMDPLSRIGSWILQDGGTNRYEQKGWLDNPKIRSLLSTIRSKHVFLVSDSCFSGDILNLERGSQIEITDEYFKKAYARRSRQVLTSGASEAVPDQSVFTRALIRLFEENTKPYLDPLMLFNEIRLTQDLTTSPLLGTLRDTDSQEGGSFIFFLKQAQPVQVKVQYDPNGATMGTVPVDGGFYSQGATAKVLSPGGLSKSGYEFVGWNTKADGTGISYKPGDTITIAGTDAALYAQWKYTIALKPQTGWIDFSDVPEDIWIYIDDKYYVNNYGKYALMPAGTHKVELVQLQWGNNFSQYVTVANSQYTKPKTALSQLADFLEEKKREAEEYQLKSKSRSTKVLLSLAGLGAAGICYLTGQSVYEHYQSASDPAKIAAYRSQAEFLSAATIASLAIGAIFTIQIPIANVPAKPDTGSMSLDDYIQKLDLTITRIRAGL